jgi:alginate O-acetyltransferase complex protein AlgI
MSGYLPRDLTTIGLLAAALAATLTAGLGINYVRSATVARWAAWVLGVVGVIGVDRLCDQEPAGLRMLALIGVLLWAMKAVVTVEARADGQPRLSPLRWLGFAALWFGMRPGVFARAGGPPLSGAGRLLRLGFIRLAEGAALVALARLTWTQPPPGLSAGGAQVLATVLLLLGLSLILHFGIFNLLAGAWRLVGVDCRPLFRAPLRARSLAEFWGRRWNLAFSEMTALAVYRPLASRLGRGPATALAFLFSGLLHELVISVPVRAGYGLPLLYFALHGTLVLVERRLEQAQRPVESLGWLAHVWTLGWLALPLPLLFHPCFLQGVVWPIIGIGSPLAGDAGSWFRW